MKRSKRYAEMMKKFDRSKSYKVDEALKLLKEVSTAKFNQTVNLTIKLGVDPKKSEQAVRGLLMLPHGIGKTRVVAVVTKGDKLKEAKESGADLSGYTELIEDIGSSKAKFDVLIATPDVMKDLGKLAKMLGPKGLMPNPKAGTVTFELAEAIKRIKAGEMSFRNNDSGIINFNVGKLSFDETKLKENIDTAIDTIIKAKPVSAKGQYLKGIILASTMGPGIKIVLPKN